MPKGNFILSFVYLQHYLPGLELAFVKNVRRKKDEKLLEQDSGDGYTAMRIYLVPLSHTLKNG